MDINWYQLAVGPQIQGIFYFTNPLHCCILEYHFHITNTVHEEGIIRRGCAYLRERYLLDHSHLLGIERTYFVLATTVSPMHNFIFQLRGIWKQAKDVSRMSQCWQLQSNMHFNTTSSLAGLHRPAYGMTPASLCWCGASLPASGYFGWGKCHQQDPPGSGKP